MMWCVHANDFAFYIVLYKYIAFCIVLYKYIYKGIGEPFGQFAFI